MNSPSPLFVSHGAPTLAIDPGTTGPLLEQLGREHAGAGPILCVSAHWEAPVATVSTAAQPAIIYDFEGFPRELYRLEYPAPGAPVLATAVLARLTAVGIAARGDPQRGLDHGAWVPLRYLVPAANIPVTQLSLIRGGSTAQHYALGAALAPLLEAGVWLIGSGGVTHNLYEFGGHAPDAPTEPWASEFADWMTARAADGDLASLLDYRRRAPHAQRNHPTEEHLMPLFVVLGATGGRALARRAGGTTYGVFVMDAFEPAPASARRAAA